MEDHAELKHLTFRLNELKSSKKVLQEEKKTVEEKIQKEQKEIAKLEKEIEKIKTTATSKGELVVSEHAMLRYFERVLGFDLNEIKKLVLPEETLTSVRILGNGTFPTPTHKVKIRDNVVVTVV